MLNFSIEISKHFHQKC